MNLAVELLYRMGRKNIGEEKLSNAEKQKR